MSEKRDTLAEALAYLDACRPIRHTTTGSNQWRAMHPNGSKVEFPRVLDHVEFGRINTSRLFFQRKRDVVDALSAFRADVARRIDRITTPKGARS